MQANEKALLLNVLVLPGAGHFLLKKPFAGSIYAFLSLACLGFIMWRVFVFSQFVADEIQQLISEGGDLSFMGMIVQAASAFDFTEVVYAVLILMLVWLIAIIDVYRIGKQSL